MHEEDNTDANHILNSNLILRRNYVQSDKNRKQGAARRAGDGARHRADTGVYERGDLRRDKGRGVGAGSEAHQVSGAAVQHLSPPPAPGRRKRPRARRSAQNDALGRSHSDRQRRLSGVFSCQAAQYQGGGRDLQLPYRRQKNLYGTRGKHDDPVQSRLHHRHGV